jgi:hypothetical protein
MHEYHGRYAVAEKHQEKQTFEKYAVFKEGITSQVYS